VLREGPGFLPAPDVTVTLPVIRGTHAVNKGLVDSAAATVSFTADVLAGVGPGPAAADCWRASTAGTTVEVTAVPEPATVWLLAGCLGGLTWLRRRV